MKEALRLQAAWEERIQQLTGGRKLDELTPEEQSEFLRIGEEFNLLIDEQIQRVYPAPRGTKARWFFPYESRFLLRTARIVFYP